MSIRKHLGTFLCLACAMHYYRCEDVTVHDCTIVSDVIDGVRGPSTDGIDIDVCRDFTVRNVTMDVNDDAVVVKGGKGVWADDYTRCPGNGPSENVLVEKCRFRSVCLACLAIGSECPSATNVVLRDCVVEGARDLLLLKMRVDTPQHFSNIRVENCRGTCRNFLNPISCRCASTEIGTKCEFCAFRAKTDCPPDAEYVILYAQEEE